jgi:hypothetical protein
VSSFVFEEGMDAWRSAEAEKPLPDEVPASVRFYLCSLGFLPTISVTSWKRRLYRSLRVALVVVQISIVLLSSFLTLLRFLMKGHASAGEGMAALIAVPTLFLWYAVMREMETGGVASILLHDMTKRGFNWRKSARGAKRLQTVAFVITVLIILWLARKAKVSNLCEEASQSDILSGGHSAENLCTALMLANGLLLPMLVYMILGIVWATRLLCKLHQHELMWYANALAEVLEEDQGYSDLMSQLSTAELSVTFRLRWASSTWVRAVLLFLVCLCILILVIVTYLMSGKDQSMGSVILASAFLVFTAGLIIAMGLPLAQVAEVFEYDVLHALNNPLVVQNAQRYFGQQLLSHLHTLGWGFRFGQTVINLRLVMNVLAALMVTIITSVSQARCSISSDRRLSRFLLWSRLTSVYEHLGTPPA